MKKNNITTGILIKRYRKNGSFLAFEKNFLMHLPGNYEFAKQHSFKEELIDYFLIVDRFIFAYRRYLIGQLPTLHRPLKYLKIMIENNPNMAFECVCLELDLIDSIIDKYEFYELLDRYFYSDIQISKLLKPLCPWGQKKSQSI